MSLNRMIGETGPNVSSRATSISGVTWSSTVGEYSAPRRRLPTSNLAPCAMASLTRRSKNMAAASSITVPMSSVGSAGLP